MLAPLAALASLALAAAPEPPSLESPPEVAEPRTIPDAGEHRETPSLLGGRTLGAGGADWLGTAGFPAVSVTYGQGITGVDDAGGFVQMDWVASELVVGGLWRHALVRGAPDVAFRLRAGFYADFGATWAYSTNASDTGIQAVPALAASWQTGGGILALSAEVAATWTFSRGMGWVLAPRGTASFEAPLYGDLTVGGRLGLGYRAAGGGAPSSGDGRPILELSALVGYRAF